MEMIEILSAVLGVVVLVGWYWLAKMNNIIGLFFRVIWNFWFKLISLIPFFGWVSRFIIENNEND